MDIKTIFKNIGIALGGLIILLSILLTAIGMFRSCTYSVKELNEAEEAIKEQPAIFHYLPKKARYGIYEIEMFFSPENKKSDTGDKE